MAANGRAFVLVKSKNYAVGLKIWCPGGALLLGPRNPQRCQSSRPMPRKFSTIRQATVNSKVLQRRTFSESHVVAISVPTSSLEQRAGQARHTSAVGGVSSRRIWFDHGPKPQVPR